MAEESHAGESATDWSSIRQDVAHAIQPAKHAWLAPEIPDQVIDTATEKFEVPAEEQILLVVASTSSAKTGFVITHDCLYFRDTGASPDRLSFNAITNVDKSRERLVIEGPDTRVEWDLGATLIWEYSRRRTADAAVRALAIFMDVDVTPQSMFDEPVATPDDSGATQPQEAAVTIKATSAEEDSAMVEIVGIIYAVGIFLFVTLSRGAPLLGPPEAFQAWLRDDNVIWLVAAVLLAVIPRKNVARMLIGSGNTGDESDASHKD